MATGYNLVHLQIAPKAEDPTFVDVNYATTAEFNVSQDSDTLSADGKSAVTAYGAREGEGSIGFASLKLSTMSVMTGDNLSTSGDPGSEIERLEITGSGQPPSLILSAWVPNVDGNSTSAGMRVTVPNGKLAVPTVGFEQESWTEAEADLSFAADENDVMLIWESLEESPVFTGGVIPVALVAP